MAYPPSVKCTSLKKQLLRVVGGKRKLFLPVGAKTCFGGEALKKQLLQVVGGPGKLFLPVGAKTCFGGRRLSCCRGDKSVAHPTDRRHSCRRWWPRRRASLPHHPPSRAPMKQLLQVVGGPKNLFLPVGAKTRFGGWAPMKQLLLGAVGARSRGGPPACAENAPKLPTGGAEPLARTCHQCPPRPSASDC